MKKYSILVYKTENPFDNFILFKISVNNGKMKFNGFDRNLYESELLFTSKRARENVADFLAYKGFKFVYPENSFELTPESQKATAEPETANRGKWKHKNGINYYFCNVCGSGNNNVGGIKTKFCPNCGAKMETGATNE